MRAILKRHPIASAGFLLAAAATLFFTIKLIADTVYWADPAHRQQAAEEWMTPAYIARSWDVDRQALARHLDISRSDFNGRPTLKRIAQKHGVPVEEVINDVNSYLGLPQ